MRARVATVTALTIGVLAASSGPAQADHHLVKIREFSFGASGLTDAFVEIQMYEDGQNVLQGHTIRVVDSDGTPNLDQNIFGAETPDVNAVSQRTVLIKGNGGAGDQTRNNLDSDLENNAAGGALCFITTIDPVNTTDCVSWGAFTGNANLPSNAGTPIAGPLPASMAFRRKIDGGSCATALDAADDTNDSQANFETVTPGPTFNSQAPTETPCAPPPGGGGGGGTVTPANPVPMATANTPAKKKKKKKKKRKGK